MCHPVLCAVLVDYKEQVLITRIKSIRQCSQYKIYPDKREDLSKTTLWRTEASTRRQIEEQTALGTKQNDPHWVHPTPSFAWRQPMCNIYECLPSDTLHMLLKGVFQLTLEQIIILLADKYPTAKKTKHYPILLLQEQGGVVMLDYRFQQVPAYLGFRVFDGKLFSKIEQWTGNIMKSIVRQLVPVITPLLVHTAPFTLQFLRAICDLVTIVQY